MPREKSNKSAKAAKADRPAGPVDPRFAPLVDAFADDRDVTRGVMMSAYGLKVRGKIFAMLMRDAFIVKLPKARVDDIVAAGQGKRFEPRPGRAMKEWAVIDLPPASWLEIAREAHAFVSGRKA